MKIGIDHAFQLEYVSISLLVQTLYYHLSLTISICIFIFNCKNIFLKQSTPNFALSSFPFAMVLVIFPEYFHET